MHVTTFLLHGLLLVRYTSARSTQGFVDNTVTEGDNLLKTWSDLETILKLTQSSSLEDQKPSEPPVLEALSQDNVESSDAGPPSQDVTPAVLQTLDRNNLSEVYQRTSKEYDEKKETFFFEYGNPNVNKLDKRNDYGIIGSGLMSLFSIFFSKKFLFLMLLSSLFYGTYNTAVGVTNYINNFFRRARSTEPVFELFGVDLTPLMHRFGIIDVLDRFAVDFLEHRNLARKIDPSEFSSTTSIDEDKELFIVVLDDSSQESASSPTTIPRPSSSGSSSTEAENGETVTPNPMDSDEGRHILQNPVTSSPSLDDMDNSSIQASTSVTNNLRGLQDIASSEASVLRAVASESNLNFQSELPSVLRWIELHEAEISNFLSRIQHDGQSKGLKSQSASRAMNTTDNTLLKGDLSSIEGNEMMENENVIKTDGTIEGLVEGNNLLEEVKDASQFENDESLRTSEESNQSEVSSTASLETNEPLNDLLESTNSEHEVVIKDNLKPSADDLADSSKIETSSLQRVLSNVGLNKTEDDPVIDKETAKNSNLEATFHQAGDRVQTVYRPTSENIDKSMSLSQKEINADGNSMSASKNDSSLNTNSSESKKFDSFDETNDSVLNESSSSNISLGESLPLLTATSISEQNSTFKDSSNSEQSVNSSVVTKEQDLKGTSGDETSNATITEKVHNPPEKVNDEEKWPSEDSSGHKPSSGGSPNTSSPSEQDNGLLGNQDLGSSLMHDGGVLATLAADDPASLESPSNNNFSNVEGNSSKYEEENPGTNNIEQKGPSFDDDIGQVTANNDHHPRESLDQIPEADWSSDHHSEGSPSSRNDSHLSRGKKENHLANDLNKTSSLDQNKDTSSSIDFDLKDVLKINEDDELSSDNDGRTVIQEEANATKAFGDDGIKEPIINNSSQSLNMADAEDMTEDSSLNDKDNEKLHKNASMISKAGLETASLKAGADENDAKDSNLPPVNPDQGLFSDLNDVSKMAVDNDEGKTISKDIKEIDERNQGKPSIDKGHDNNHQNPFKKYLDLENNPDLFKEIPTIIHSAEPDSLTGQSDLEPGQASPQERSAKSFDNLVIPIELTISKDEESFRQIFDQVSPEVSTTQDDAHPTKKRDTDAVLRDIKDVDQKQMSLGNQDILDGVPSDQLSHLVELALDGQHVETSKSSDSNKDQLVLTGLDVAKEEDPESATVSSGQKLGFFYANRAALLSP